MLREQIDPSPAFHLLHLNIYFPTLSLIKQLLSEFLKKDEGDDEIILLSYSLIGICMVYRYNKASFDKETDKSDFSDIEIKNILDSISWQSEALLRAKLI